MTCKECVNLLLESGRDEIVHADSSELGRHLMTCPRCRAVADSILGETSRVTGVFGVERSKRKKKRGAATILGIAALLFVSGMGVQRLGHGSSQSRAAAPVATIAATKAPTPAPALAENRSLGPRIVPQPISVRPIEPTRALVVEKRTIVGDSQFSVKPPPGINAAVLQTRNPNITVVWLYQSSGEHP